LRVGALEVRSKIDLLGKAVAKIGHLAGASFTYADMNLLPVLAYLSACKESSEMLANTESLSQYFNRHSQRASFKATTPPSFSYSNVAVRRLRRETHRRVAINFFRVIQITNSVYNPLQPVSPEPAWSSGI
jgi:hypothetical protein